MCKGIKYIYTTGLIFLSLLFMTAAPAQPARNGKILLLHAYNQDIKWTSDVSDSITRHLTKYDPHLEITRIDLNYNDYPHRPFEDAAASVLKQTGAPDILLLIGDEAELVYNTALRKAPGWENIRNLAVNTRNERLRGTVNGSGAGFAIPFKDNLSLIRNMVPGVKEILWIDRPYPASGEIKAIMEREIERMGLPVELNTLYLSGDNTDAIYKTILENKPGRAILTGSWNFFDKKSAYTQKEIDSLFSGKLRTPVFSIFPNNYSNNYLVGGYNLSARVCAEKITEQTKKLLQGTPVANIAFEPVKNGDIVLNEAALQKLGMESYAKNYFEVKYVNTRPSVFDTYRYELIVCCAALILLLLFIFFFIKKSRENRSYKKNLGDIKERFKFLSNIYNNMHLNFAVYGNNGEKIMEKIAPEEQNVLKDFLPRNLFNAEFLFKEDIGLIKGKKSFSKEYNSTVLKKYARINPADGRIIFLVIKPIQTLADDAFKYIAIASDVTETQRDMIARETLNTLIKNAAEISDVGVASYNILTGKGFATENWYNNLAEKGSDGNVLPDYNNCSTEDKAKIIDFRHNLINATASRLGMDIKIYNPATGKERWIRENIFLHEYDPKRGVIEVIDINFDINKEKVQEVNLVNLNKKAEHANNDSDKFIGGISHEIRTPLNSIIGFSNMLTTLTDAGDKAEIIHIIKRNNVILIELINNILSIAKIDSGTCHFEKAKIELNEFFHELKIATAHMVTGDNQQPGKNIDIICDTPSEDHTIFTDEWNFRQVMINLLSNAVKFTREGAITFGYQPQEEGVYFYVKDTGCGIALENQERIFNRFEKFETLSSGTGLGLSLCKSIVHHLNGEIGVISKENEGSTFWFILKNESVQ